MTYRDGGRSGPIVIAAMLVPSVVFAVLLATFAVWDSGRRQEEVALATAHEIVKRSDAAVSQELRGLDAVARLITGVAIEAPRPAPERIRLNAELFPQWFGSLVWSPGDRVAIFSSLPWEEMPAIPASWAGSVAGKTGGVVGGVGFLNQKPMVFLHESVPGDERKIFLTTALRTDQFQEMLMAELPANSVGAMVDANGNFIARSLDAENRVGTPATSFVRDAITSGKAEGTYSGRTYEGLENITAFVVSPLTGWSAHIAFSNAEMSEATNLALTIGAIGGVIVLGLAALLTWLVVRDARRRQLQSLALAQVQRIESLGRLTGGIAHDFNNLLTIIIGNLQRAREAPERERSIDAALAAAKRAADLTRSLMAYSRQQPLTPKIVDANACVREAREVIGRTLGEAYVVKQDLGESAGAIRVDPSQLISALVNLAVNARDAMADGGVITISTEFRPASANAAGSDRGSVAITVSDNGPGMDADVASRAFEPFFTTKDVGKGTGLGLAQVQGFATQSGGSVELVTAPGAGTAITLVFSQAENPPPIAQDAATQTSPAAQTARILLVEDDAGVRENAEGLLTAMGHAVVACGDGIIAEAELRNGRFDLMFSDVVLPGGRSGVKLAEIARSIDPAMQVLLTTGYAGDELVAATGDYPLLPKPYEAADLARAIAASLAVRPRSTGRILLVDDEPLILLWALEVLEDAGYQAIGAASIKEAMMRASEHQIDVAILDIGLPDGSGLDLARDLGAQHAGMRIIIASGQALDESALAKPYTAEQLLAAVRSAARA